MKAQTSLEFLIITGALGILILGAIVQYSSIFGQAKQISNLSNGTFSIHPNETFLQDPTVVVNIPANSSAGQENPMHVAAYGCSNGTLAVSLNSSSVSFDPKRFNGSFFSAGFWTGSFYPGSGQNNISASYVLSCQGKDYNGSEYISTVSRDQQASQYPAQYSAYIYDRNETVSYSLLDQGVVSLSESEHCTDRNAFSETPFGIGIQCGTSDAWEYMAESDYCYDHGSPTLTVCIVPYYSGYNISTVIPYAANEVYSANVSITGGVDLNFSISSKDRDSKIEYDGRDVGNATVYNVSAQGTAPDVALLSGSSSGYVNSTSMQQYLQAMNSLYSILEYYNSTEVTSDSQVQINQTISSYNKAEDLMVSSASQQPQYGCEMHAGVLGCVPQYPFYYSIAAQVSPAYLGQNQTLSFEGSIIRVYN